MTRFQSIGERLVWPAVLCALCLLPVLWRVQC